jgi:hypothetical protein
VCEGARKQPLQHHMLCPSNSPIQRTHAPSTSPKGEPSRLPVFRATSSYIPPKTVHGRTNGADIYVVRTAAAGPADAAPCARCLAWCTWAGIQRAFFWSASRGGFACAKVAQPGENVYATRSDRTRGVGRESFER